MSDEYFDILRANGEYPRKGYGWLPIEDKKQEILSYVEKGHLPPWVLREAERFDIKVNQ